MHKIDFEVKPCQESNDHQVRILVDGWDLIELFKDDMLGIDPPEFFANHVLLDSGELIIARCGCGVVECGSATVYLMRQGATVIWDQFCPGIEGINSLIFSRSQFDSAVEAGKNNHSWESIERTAERLIGEIDFPILQEHDLEFAWASGRFNTDYISVCLYLASQYQVIVHAPWDHSNAEVAVEIVRAELAKPPIEWSNVIFYPQQANLGDPPIAGPGWRRG